MASLSRNLVTVLGALHRFAINGNQNNPVYGWKDLTTDLAAGRGIGANAPTWAVFRDGIEAYSFSASTMNELWVVFHPNHDSIEGEDFFPHIHWSVNTTSTGTVRWGFEYSIAKGFDQEAFPASTTVYAEQTISSDKQYQHLIAEVSTGIAMPEIDSLIMVRVFRDAADVADDFPDAAFALTADIHYRSGRHSTIGKRPDFDQPD